MGGVSQIALNQPSGFQNQQRIKGMSHTVEDKSKEQEKRHIGTNREQGESGGKTMAPPPFALTSGPLQAKGLGENNQEPTQMKSSGGGSKLPGEVSQKMETAMGENFSGVNIHTNSQQANSVGAHAFTQGNDVHFAPGQFNPGTQKGQELIGHELAHVVQQKEGRVQANTDVNGVPVNDNKGLESEADKMGEMAAKGEVTQRKESTNSGTMTEAVQRKENTDTNVSIQSGELTRLGEGSGAATKYVHWPETDASGVTLGQGYDIGSRSEQQVIDELVAAGMDKTQATKISKGAGKKGSAAGDWVKANKTDVGEIPVAVQNVLLSQMLEEYTQKAKTQATNTKADANGANAAAREKKDGVAAGTYVLTATQWNNLHPAMVEFLTDLIYQGGFYAYDRVAKINKELVEHDGNHVEQFKGVRDLFTGEYMDDYAKKIGMGTSKKGAKETFFGQEMNLEGEIRRNQIRLAYLNKVITALEGGKTVTMNKGTEATTTTTGDQQEQAPTLNNNTQTQTPAAPQGQTQNQQTYKVVKGDSLWSIAQKYGVSIDDLKTWNADKLKTWGSVQGFNAGETIVIKSGGSSTSGNSQATSQTTGGQTTTAAKPATTAAAPKKDTAPAFDFDGVARTVHQAFFGGFMGLGTDEQAVFTALSSLGKDDAKIKGFMAAYRKNFNRDFMADLRSEMSNSWLGNDLDKALSYLNMGPGAVKAQTPTANAGGAGKGTATPTQKPVAQQPAKEQAQPAAKEGGSKPEGDYSRFDYASQRDNGTKSSNNFGKYTGEINGDNMCNVTTLAMQLRSMSSDDAKLNSAAAQILIDKGHSGKKEDLVKLQLEDLIMKIFIQLGDKYFKDNVGIAPSSEYGPHQYASGLNHVGAMFTDYVGKAEHYGAAVNGEGVVDKDGYKTKIKPALDKGGSVMLSTKLTGGHIIMLVDVLEDGIVVHDPYGMRMPGGYVKNGDSVSTRKARITDAGDVYTNRLKKNSTLKSSVDKMLENPGAQKFGQNLGEKNFYPWDEVSTYRIGKWVNILHAKA